MVRVLAYPFSILRYALEDLSSPPFHMIVSDATSDWLVHLSLDNPRGPWTQVQRSLQKCDHRDIFFFLLQILLPCEHIERIEELSALDRLKWRFVDLQEFEQAANVRDNFVTKLATLAQLVATPIEITREHIEMLFEQLNINEPGES